MAPRTRRTAVAGPVDNGSVTKSEITRARILDAAATVLSRKGYSGMRLTDVAEVAEVQAPAIYYYFDSRDALIEEVMWVGIAHMREHLTKVLDELPDGIDPLERILVAVDAHLRHELEISAYTTASIRNAGQVPDKIRSRQVTEEAKYGRIWRDLMRQAHDAGAIRQDIDLYIARMLVLGSLNWAAEWWKPRRGSIDKVVRNAQALVRSALAGP
ncbi:MAG TPA: TetR/AcrR family transcriptional regulator [Aldersonia sp.]